MLLSNQFPVFGLTSSLLTSFEISSKILGFNGISIYIVPATQHNSPCLTSSTRSTRLTVSPAIWKPSQASAAIFSTAGLSFVKRKKYRSAYCCWYCFSFCSSKVWKFLYAEDCRSSGSYFWSLLHITLARGPLNVRIFLTMAHEVNFHHSLGLPSSW